ncbi:DUF1707 SHOCT-like domain-containing protein [Saccharothrix obliqua]|uniref:DUF1707 SHOCT-like domain-containing protein n=1 Tax=Saccharothrix obliqua TaxID=2861747 RepID=UPI001C60494F|nr:DUF1707 domain-containing protein [Saccharothrix obliqua]MBW4715982.1 DUF1707 domain-containing protein [Saccharothrix obliqua]
MSHPVRPEELRASDAEREFVQQWLHRAHVAGSLDLAEFDLRVSRAWSATTRGELAALTADLPRTALTADVSPATTPTAPTTRPGGRPVLAALTTIWLSLSALNFTLWLLVSVLGGNGPVHPWFLWVVVPAGSVLGVVRLMGRPR